ncbi:MAG: glycosyltransferase [Phycicoccus sp.]|nr:glycosyltransferase [Phycicoccus sp.]
MSARRLLIISPSFHGYWRALQDAFTTLGYETSTHRYDEHSTVAAKARVKASELANRVSGRMSTRETVDVAATAKAVDAIRTTNPDVVLLIKADAFGADLWDLLNARPGPHALWLYDEVRRTRHTAATLDAAGLLASYSPLDVSAFRKAGRDVLLVPGAFDTTVTYTPRPAQEVVFVGARYPVREDLLCRLHAAGVPVRAYGRDWSHHLADRARTWRVSTPDLPSARDLPRADAYGVMSGATASLNIHFDQDGFTMRTFETPGVGGLQLVDRPDIGDLYDPGTEVAVFTSPEEAIDLARRAARDDRWSRELRARGQARTLAEHTFLHRARGLESLWA